MSAASIPPHGITEEQRLAAILTLEGMPAELPLLVDSPDYVHVPDEDAAVSAPHQQVQAALSLDDATPVDTFMLAQEPLDYRFKD